MCAKITQHILRAKQPHLLIENIIDFKKNIIRVNMPKGYKIIGGNTVGNIKIAIVDDNESVVNWLKEIVSGDTEIQVVGTSFNGMDALTMIKVNKPDLVLLDLNMPKLDGIGVMKQINFDVTYEKIPAFIIMSETGEEGAIANAFAIGASYFIIKPFDKNMILTRIKQVKGSYKYKNAIINNRESICKKEVENIENNLEWQVTEIIHKIGVPPHIKGYQYLRDGIIMSVKDNQMLHSVTKILYPAIAKMHNTTSIRVERAIRNAILVAWNRGTMDMKEEVFGYIVNRDKRKPTNSEFMAVVTDKIKIKSKIPVCL